MKKKESTLVEVNREHLIEFMKRSDGYIETICKSAGTTKQRLHQILDNPLTKTRRDVLVKLVRCNEFEKNGWYSRRVNKYPEDYLIK